METVFLVKAKIEKFKKEEYNFYKTSNRLINKLVYISKKIFQSKQILTQINSTIKLDSDCYKLYQDKDGNNYLDVVCLDKNKRIKAIKLTRYKFALPKKLNKNFFSSLVISFNSTDMSFYIHFSFKDFKKIKKKTNKTSIENKESQTLGMDFGITEKAFLAHYLMELLLELNKARFSPNLIKNQSNY